jgi:hypothetical protein
MVESCNDLLWDFSFSTSEGIDETICSVEQTDVLWL